MTKINTSSLSEVTQFNKIEQLFNIIKLNKEDKLKSNLKIINYIRNDLFNKLKLYFDNTDAINIESISSFNEYVFDFKFEFHFKDLTNNIVLKNNTIQFTVEIFPDCEITLSIKANDYNKIYTILKTNNEFKYCKYNESESISIEDGIFNCLISVNS